MDGMVNLRSSHGEQHAALLGRLIDRRRRVGLGRSGMARRLGVSPSMMTQMERGVRPVPPRLMIQWCSIVAAAPGEMICPSGSEQQQAIAAAVLAAMSNDGMSWVDVALAAAECGSKPDRKWLDSAVSVMEAQDE